MVVLKIYNGINIFCKLTSFQIKCLQYRYGWFVLMVVDKCFIQAEVIDVVLACFWNEGQSYLFFVISEGQSSAY